jgi:hypothetical protein
MHRGPVASEPAEPTLMAAAGPYDGGVRASTKAADTTVPERLRFSDALLRLVALNGTPRITVGEIVEALGDRAFGAIMLIFAAPNAFPVSIPGTSAITAVPICIAALQLTLGRRVLRLPGLVAARSLARADFATLVGRMLPWIRWAERRVRPAWLPCVSPLAERIAGGVVLLLGVVLFLPLPLGNLLPGIAVALIGLGVMERDGRAVLLGYVVAVISLLVVAAVMLGIAGAVWFVATEIVEP